MLDIDPIQNALIPQHQLHQLAKKIHPISASITDPVRADSAAPPFSCAPLLDATPPKPYTRSRTTSVRLAQMLKLTKKADYSLIALRHLALVAEGSLLGPAASLLGPTTGPTSASAKEISDAYHIPLPILSKVLQKLGKAGFLASVQGTNGGYRLARDPHHISVLEVIRAVDGPVILTACFTGNNHCDQSGSCTVKEPLRKVHEGILNLLESISIAALTKDDPIEETKNSAASRPTPYSVQTAFNVLSSL